MRKLTIFLIVLISVLVGLLAYQHDVQDHNLTPSPVPTAIRPTQDPSYPIALNYPCYELDSHILLDGKHTFYAEGRVIEVPENSVAYEPLDSGDTPHFCVRQIIEPYFDTRQYPEVYSYQ